MKRRRFWQTVVVSVAAAILLPISSVSSPVNDPFTPAQRKYWAFQKVERPAVPEASRAGWVRNPIDAFVAAKLEFAQAEERRIMTEALGALPEKERAALVLRDLEGLSTAEVAEVLGSSETTVRSQISRARIKLRADRERRLKERK